jgi:rubrerythrin
LNTLGKNTLGHWFLSYDFQVVPAEVLEEKKENDGDSAEAAATNPVPSPTNKRKRKPGKTILSEDEQLSQAINFIMHRVPDEFDTFGEYVAMELRSLTSEAHRKMLKREIRQSVARIAELDDLNSLATSTKSSEAPSPDVL